MILPHPPTDALCRFHYRIEDFNLFISNNVIIYPEQENIFKLDLVKRDKTVNLELNCIYYLEIMALNFFTILWTSLMGRMLLQVTKRSLHCSFKKKSVTNVTLCSDTPPPSVTKKINVFFSETRPFIWTLFEKMCFLPP